MAEQQDDQLPPGIDWVMGMLEPGTRPGVFTFFKLVTVALVVCIASMLFALDVPPDVKIHLKIFLTLSVLLMIITMWYARGSLARCLTVSCVAARWHPFCAALVRCLPCARSLTHTCSVRSACQSLPASLRRACLDGGRFFHELQNAPPTAPAAEEPKKDK
jgi:hypothetical protein